MMSMVHCLRLWLVGLLTAATAEHYYAILGIPPDASSAQLKSAYRKMSLKYHPDRNQDDKRGAEQRFMEINEAYAVLSDPAKRALYDHKGKGGLEREATRSAHREAEKARKDAEKKENPLQNLFGTSVPGVTEFDKTSWQEMIEENSQRRSIIVVFYEPGCAVCPTLKQILSEFAEKLAAQGLIEVGAVNCVANKKYCADIALPAVFYYGPENAERQSYPTHQLLTYAAMSQWSLAIMPDYTRVIKDERKLQDWLVSDDDLPKVILFSEKSSMPALWKAMGIEFWRRASLAVVPVGSAGEQAIRARFGVRQLPAILHVRDERKLTGMWFDKTMEQEHLSLWLSRAVGWHRTNAGSAVLELTPTRLRSGVCGKNDPFCLVLIASHGVSEAALTSLQDAAQRLKQDPVKVFYAKDPSVTQAFGQLSGTAVLYRPKRGKFNIYDGNINDSGSALAEWAGNEICCGFQLPYKLQFQLVV